MRYKNVCLPTSQQSKYTKQGFTLIDVLVGTALFIIVMVGFFIVFQFLFKVLSQSQNKTIAIALANEQIEIVRNIPYEDIGTKFGSPSGEIPQTRTEITNDKTFTIITDIIYIDDPFDGVSPTDEFSGDYKKARIEVLWEEHQLIKSIVEIANFSPPNLESEIGGGVFSVYVNDRESGFPISNAQIEIINNETNPSIHIITMTDNNGWLSRPGLAESDNYEIHTNQTGYDEHKTYPNSLIFKPEPEYSHAKISEGDKITRYFLISKISTINIKTVDNNNNILPNMSFRLSGGRAIGIDLDNKSIIYSYENDNLTTDLNGEKQLDNMSGGEYYFEITNPNYAILTPNIENPLIIEADSEQSIILTLAPVNEPYLRIIIKDSETKNGISQATVRLHNEDYDKTSQSNEYGIAIFPFDKINLLNGNYTLNISKLDYQDYDNSQIINNFTEKNIELIPNE